MKTYYLQFYFGGQLYEFVVDVPAKSRLPLHIIEHAQMILRDVQPSSMLKDRTGVFDTRRRYALPELVEHLSDKIPQPWIPPDDKRRAA